MYLKLPLVKKSSDTVLLIEEILKKVLQVLDMLLIG